MKKILLLLLLATTVLALPSPNGWVNDYADIIEPEWKEQIATLIDSIEKNTTAEIAVVTVNSLDDKTVEELGLQYLEEWGVGKKQNDNGIVILVAPNERKYRIEVGYGAEGVVTDARAGRIGREILALHFKEQQYGEGIYRAVEEIGGLLREDPEIVAQYSPRIEFLDFLAPWIFFLGLIVTKIISSATASRKKNRFVKFCVAEGIFAGILLAIGLWAPHIAFLLAGPFFFIVGLIMFAGASLHAPTTRWFGGGFSGGGGFGGFGGGGGGGGGSSGGW